MDVKEEKLIGDAVGRHWYYVSKGKALRSFLQGVHVGAVLDVGAGSGVFSRQLLADGVCDRAICLDPNYAADRTETSKGRQLEFVRKVDSAPRELILMMDVLEHVADDAGLLRQFARQLRPGGLILISVPAFQFLWSGHDIFLEHKRRYSLAGLEALVAGEGLELIRSRYYFGLLFPVVALMRLFDRLRLQAGAADARSALKVYPAALNWLLVRLHDVERVLVLPFNRLFGLTVFCLARKPAD